MITKRTTILACAVVLTAAAAYSAWPQEKGGPSPQDKAKKPVPWTFVFDHIEHYDTPDTGKATNVTATSDEGTVIKTDMWSWDDKKKTAHGTGNLKMTDPQADATGDSADVFYAKGKRLLVLSGNCVILVKPKREKEAPKPPPGPAPVSFQDGKATVEVPTADEDDNSSAAARKYPATITCEKVEYEYAKTKKHAVLTGSFKVVQKLRDHTRTLTAEYGEWFGLEDRVLLHGPVHMEDTKGLKSFETKSDVTVHTKEGDESFEAGAGTGTYELQGDDEEDSGKPADSGKKSAEPAKKPTEPGKTTTPPNKRT